MAVALLAAACGDDGAVQVASADIERRDLPPERAAPAAESIGDLGWDLYRSLASEDTNLVFSPHSIGVALTMTRAGAEGETAAEMDEVLHLGGTADPHGSINALDLALATAAGERERPDGSTAEVVIDIANAFWAQEGFGFEPPFLATLAEDYGAGVRLVDFAGDHEAAREEINDWVATQTNDRIEKLLGPGVLSALTRAVLTNAVYLNAPWQHPFDENATATAPFTTLDGSEVEAELMSTTGPFRYARVGSAQVVELPYLGGELSMVVVVPDLGAFDATAASLDGGGFRAILEALGPAEVALRFPTFDVTTQASLVPPLKALGMTSAFDPELADFSAMTEDAPLHVSDVVHQAFITVDEAGTEAGAAPAVVMDLTAAPVEVVELVVDRPFLYAITHGPSSSLLFLGHVVDPQRSTGD